MTDEQETKHAFARSLSDAGLGVFLSIGKRMLGLDVVFTHGTPKIASVRLQYCFLTLVYTCCANVVKWLSLLHAFLQRMSKSFRLELMKSIALHLTFPIFNLLQFFFKVGYLAGERRLFLQTGERNNGGIYKLCVDLGYCGNQLVVIGKAVRRLRNIKGGFGTGNGGGNLSEHDVTPNTKVRGAP